jgi:hypothetical protein
LSARCDEIGWLSLLRPDLKSDEHFLARQLAVIEGLYARMGVVGVHNDVAVTKDLRDLEVAHAVIQVRCDMFSCEIDRVGAESGHTYLRYVIAIIEEQHLKYNGCQRVPVY